MSTAWVAGSVRAKAMARRRLGVAATRAVARLPDLQTAVGSLAGTPYGHDVRVDQTLAEAQHAVGATLLWHLRVLAGWVPREGADMLRILAGAFEIANVDEHLQALRGRPTEKPFRLGTLATAWGRLATTTSVDEMRDVLTASAWGAPGDDNAAALHLGLRLSWAARVQAGVPGTGAWAAGAAALLVARETFVARRRLSTASVRPVEALLGLGWQDARTLADFAAALPPEARWVVADVGSVDALWRAEAAWWRRVEHDGFSLLRRPEFGAAALVGSAAVLAADAWQVRAALEAAARGGQASEVFDGVV